MLQFRETAEEQALSPAQALSKAHAIIFYSTKIPPKLATSLCRLITPAMEFWESPTTSCKGD